MWSANHDQGMRRRVALLFVATLIGLSGAAQKKYSDGNGEMRMGPVVRASAPGENIFQLWADADPTDGRHVMACGLVVYPQANLFYGYVYSSADGGATWRRTLLDNATRFVSEESCTYGRNGRAYFVDGESDTSTGMPRHEWGHMQLFVSHDHGMSWKPSGRREWVDWPMLAALPPDRRNAESLVIFGNSAADRLGHWLEKRPVALEATNDGRTLSSLAIAPATSLRSFGFGSVALPDRTALFAVGGVDPKFANNPAQHEQANVFAYRPSEHSLELRAVLRNEPGHSNGWPFLVRDASRRFHGRLYAAWSEIAPPGSHAWLWLASSDDNGYHWSSRAISSVADYRTPAGCPTDFFAVPPSVKIAVNRDGLLGVLWKLDGQTLLFTSSTDGGRTFGPAQLVARQPMGELSVTDGVPFNERFLAESVAVRQVKGVEFLRTLFDPSHLGLSIRLEEHNGIQEATLVASAKNTFHALWTGVNTDGTYALLTRTIDVPVVTTGTTHSELTQAVATSNCSEGTRLVEPEALSPAPSVEVVGKTDVTGSITLEVDHLEYSREEHIAMASVTLTNKSESTLRARLTLFGLELHSDFGVASALNADGTQQGQPYWDASAAVPADGLPPKARSKPIQLRFKIDQFHSAPIGDAVAMYVRVFADPAH